MHIWGFAAGNFSFLLLQEEPRTVANTGEQNKARADKQKFRNDPFSKQEKRQVRGKSEEIYPGFFVYSLFNVPRFFLQLLEIIKLVHKYAFSNTVLSSACVSCHIFMHNNQFSKYEKNFSVHIHKILTFFTYIFCSSSLYLL